jgi:hypothetical protein
MGFQMRMFLLSTTVMVALATQLQLARAADIEPIGNLDRPTTFISFEGGTLFDTSPTNASFDEDNDKLGALGSLQPGDWGQNGRFDLGQQLTEDWDFKIAAALTFLGDDSEGAIVDNSSSAGFAEAAQKTSFQTLDVEIGYQIDALGAIDTRVFAGARALHSTTQLEWNFEGEVDKLGDITEGGDFSDEVWSIGPRIGIDVAVPLNSTKVSLVGSASGSLLFGSVGSQYSFDGDSTDQLTDWSDSQTLWNLEGMAGVSFGVGGNADLTIGYRAAQFGGLITDRSDIDSDGGFSEDGRSDLLVHGPFARLTVEIP